MGVDELLKNELGEKRWKIRKRLIETDEKMRSKTVDRLIESMPKHISDQVDAYAEKTVKKNLLLKEVQDSEALWVKCFNMQEWILCEWKIFNNVGFARVLIGDFKYIDRSQIEEFIIIEKPETLRPNQVRGREVDQNAFEFDSKL